MNRQKKKSLDSTYRKFLETGLTSDTSQPLQELVDGHVAGYGTAIDEKILGIRELRKLISYQQKQVRGMKIRWKIIPFSHSITADGNTAVYADDIYLSIGAGKDRITMYLRFSVVLYYRDNAWKVIHWHGSKPEQVLSGQDSFGIESWKQKAVHLQKLVDEKTADLLARNRDLEVEAALERVRTVAMGMKSREDMLWICQSISEQLEKLGVQEIRNVQTAIFYEDRGTYMNYEYYAKHRRTFITEVDFMNHRLQRVFARKMMKGPGGELSERLKGKALHDWYAFQKTTNQFADKYILKADSLNYYWFSLGPVALGISTYLPLEKEATAIFRRFLKVFGLAYRRYLDIEKAESQAREAQIEAALEKVRARSLGMHHTTELQEVVTITAQQLHRIGMDINGGVFICINQELDSSLNIWASGGAADYVQKVTVPFLDRPIFTRLRHAIQDGEQLLTEMYSRKEKLELFAHLFKHEPWKQLPAARKKELRSRAGGFARSVAISRYTSISVTNHNGKAFSAEENEIVKRFGKVFEQSYIRFLDLQTAEAQAREAQIEAALERVRSRSMGMQQSGELEQVIQAVYEQMVQLNIPVEHTGFILDYKNRNDYVSWIADHLGSPSHIVIPYFDSPYYNRFNEAKKKGEIFFALNLVKEEKNKFYRNLFRHLPGFPEASKAYLLRQPALTISTVLMTDVSLYIENFSGKAFSEEENEVLIRFGNVFQQSYTRFLDLKKAEAQAREAQVEAALEKVRGRTLAMQKSDELAETAAVLFQQLIGLGIEPNRLYIILTKEDNPSMEAWVTDEDGTKVSMGFTGNYEKNPSLRKMYDGWKSGRASLVIDMQGEELQQYFHYLHEELQVPFKGGLKQKRRVQHIAFFSHGLIGMASPEEQPAETLQLLERFAAVFNLTFTRFNDLKVAEAHAEQAERDLIAIKEAKQKAEDALTELQITQKQLIQSEKMASLGELTAGIAHEIQNPLNFVNNFSEVSRELIDEIREELENGNLNAAKEIMKDVIQNLEKIHHHGKRADEIVKGMLQHSRTGSGQKELTDINALCDEYMRLSYHGLRAKDKSFNARFELKFDESVGKVNVLPQDLGRVILNLINNAFYAVAERKRQSEPGYDPVVKISTQKENNQVTIRVQDNGGGITPQVLDKIFQPFFTTKPTGQGTGLGLSLSYDIVKAHGGEIIVETKEGEGTSFRIQLPV